MDNPNQKDYFECEKIELEITIKNPDLSTNWDFTFYKDISQFISEINPDFYQTINKKVIEDLKDKRK